MAGAQAALPRWEGSGSLSTAPPGLGHGLAQLWAPAHPAGARLVHASSLELQLHPCSRGLALPSAGVMCSGVPWGELLCLLRAPLLGKCKINEWRMQKLLAVLQNSQGQKLLAWAGAVQHSWCQCHSPTAPSASNPQSAGNPHLGLNRASGCVKPGPCWADPPRGR